jgi:hypothetical protein
MQFCKSFKYKFSVMDEGQPRYLDLQFSGALASLSRLSADKFTEHAD